MDSTQTACAVLWALLAYGSVAFAAVMIPALLVAWTRRRLAGSTAADIAEWEREVERLP
jgi:hypothetical protein